MDNYPEFKNLKRFAIMGGTFDPIHTAHLAIAQAALYRMDLERVIFMPTGTPPHKPHITSPQHRLNMTLLATQDNPAFRVSGLETDSRVTTYTIDTIRRIRGFCGMEAEVFMIVGSDTLNSMTSWKDYKQLSGLVDFIVATRPGSKPIVSDELNELFNIYFIDAPEMDISSTAIRDALQMGICADYLIPVSVARYVERYELYTPKHIYDVKTTLKTCAERVSSKRFAHIQGVVRDAGRLARFYGESENTARMAAALHDICKGLTDAETKKLCKTFGVKMDEYAKNFPEIMHGFLGAEVAAREFGVSDENLLNAIRYHTTGRPDMSLLEKIIFVSDLTESGRESYDLIDMVRRYAYTDFDLAVRTGLLLKTRFTAERGKTVHPLSIEALEFYENQTANR